MLGSTCSAAKKAFKVNVACADGMLMSAVTFPEVSGGLFFIFFDALHGFGGMIKMFTHTQVSSDLLIFKSKWLLVPEPNLWEAGAPGQTLGRHQKSRCCGLTQLHPSLQGATLSTFTSDWSGRG